MEKEGFVELEELLRLVRPSFAELRQRDQVSQLDALEDMELFLYRESEGEGGSSADSELPNMVKRFFGNSWAFDSATDWVADPTRRLYRLPADVIRTVLGFHELELDWRVVSDFGGGDDPSEWCPGTFFGYFIADVWRTPFLVFPRVSISPSDLPYPGSAFLDQPNTWWSHELIIANVKALPLRLKRVSFVVGFEVVWELRWRWMEVMEGVVSAVRLRSNKPPVQFHAEFRLHGVQGVAADEALSLQRVLDVMSTGVVTKIGLRNLLGTFDELVHRSELWPPVLNHVNLRELWIDVGFGSSFRLANAGLSLQECRARVLTLDAGANPYMIRNPDTVIHTDPNSFLFTRFSNLPWSVFSPHTEVLVLNGFWVTPALLAELCRLLSTATERGKSPGYALRRVEFRLCVMYAPPVELLAHVDEVRMENSYPLDFTEKLSPGVSEADWARHVVAYQTAEALRDVGHRRRNPKKVPERPEHPTLVVATEVPNAVDHVKMVVGVNLKAVGIKFKVWQLDSRDWRMWGEL
jgi:hypothetical protein